MTNEGFLQAAPPFLKELIAGGVAGALGKTSVAPLERVKILIQTGNAPSKSVPGVLRHIYHADGALGLYKGNGASVARIVPYAAIHFACYERARAALVAAYATYAPAHKTHPPSSLELLAGSSSGAVAVVATYPLDLVHTRLAWNLEAKPGAPAATIAATLRSIVASEGAFGLYRGMAPTLLGILPYSGFKFWSYQRLKRAYWSAIGVDVPSGRLPILVTLACGATAGLVAQTLTYPLDILRRRIQVARSGGGRASMAATFMSIVNKHGLRGLFHGLTVNYIKVLPSTAVGFTTYEHLKHLLALENHL